MAIKLVQPQLKPIKLIFKAKLNYGVEYGVFNCT
jgi:hypothetical protein